MRDSNGTLLMYVQAATQNKNGMYLTTDGSSMWWEIMKEEPEKDKPEPIIIGKLLEGLE